MTKLGDLKLLPNFVAGEEDYQKPWPNLILSFDDLAKNNGFWMF